MPSGPPRRTIDGNSAGRRNSLYASAGHETSGSIVHIGRYRWIMGVSGSRPFADQPAPLLDGGTFRTGSGSYRDPRGRTTISVCSSRTERTADRRRLDNTGDSRCDFTETERRASHYAIALDQIRTASRPTLATSTQLPLPLRMLFCQEMAVSTQLPLPLRRLLRQVIPELSGFDIVGYPSSIYRHFSSFLRISTVESPVLRAVERRWSNIALPRVVSEDRSK